MDYSLLCGLSYVGRDDPVTQEPAAQEPASQAEVSLSSTLSDDAALKRGAEAEAGGGEAGGEAHARPSALSIEMQLQQAALRSRVARGGGPASNGTVAMVEVQPAAPSARQLSAEPSALQESGRLESSSSSISQSVAAGRASVNTQLVHRQQLRPLPAWVDAPDGAVEGNMGPDDEQVFYFIAIIDILTAWSPAKATENRAKILAHPLKPSSISCVPPLQYADRFERALDKWL